MAKVDYIIDEYNKVVTSCSLNKYKYLVIVESSTRLPFPTPQLNNDKVYYTNTLLDVGYHFSDTLPKKIKKVNNSCYSHAYIINVDNSIVETYIGIDNIISITNQDWILKISYYTNKELDYKDTLNVIGMIKMDMSILVQEYITNN